MPWSQELDYRVHHLTLTRNESDPKPHTSPGLPPAPGAGDIRFPALYLYSNGEALHLEAEINGNKIARVYLDVYFEAENGWLAGPVYRCMVDAPQSREIGGVPIPIWAENNKLSAIWKPAVPLLICGNEAAWGFARPAQSNPKEIWINAIWISEKREQSVRLSFSLDGELTRMTILDKDNVSAHRGSRGQLPQPGDQITPAVNWLHREDKTWQIAPGSSNAITITNQSLHLEKITCPPGRYHIGLLVYDLDNQPHREMIAFKIPATGLNKG